MPRAASKQKLPMREMADLDAVHLGLDENEADIAEELQDFEFNTRSEASESNGGDSTDSEPSISSVSTATSSLVGSGKRKTKKLAKESPQPTVEAKSSKSSSSKNKGKREPTPEDLNGGKKKKRTGSESKKSTSSESPEKVKAKSPPAEERQPAAKKSRTKKPSNLNDSVGHKSDASEAEDEKPALPALESDSESSDSDSGTQHKRNGGNGGGNGRGKPNSKSSTPEKDSGGVGSQPHSQKGYDYMTKLNYLFRDTRFFLIKSNNSDNVQLSKSKSVWATLPQNDANLNQAFKEARNVLLIFSVNESGKFAGFARMAAPSRRDIPQVAWVLPPSISSKALGGVIELDWICRKELSFNATLHLHNTWNEGKPVKIGRDGQEIEPKIGGELCRLFPEDEQIELTPILKKSKETARVMREKGIHVIYKPPRSLSSRGHGGGGGRGGGRGASHDQLGPMRHKRSYHGPPHHRPYRHHHGMGLPPGGGFKRSGSPYRQMGSGGGAPPGGPGDMAMPSWERYMSSAAAAEAYVADYMRNMHGQLPPLPFVPPFAQLPMPGAGAGAAGALPPGAAAMYEQLPPPVRYYDGPGAPPLPDYPPPQRPPPPGFDKAPSYEEFAAWKNAGLPTVPPPGFPVYGGPANGGSNGAGGVAAAQAAAGGSMGGGGSGGGMGGPGGYRNRDGNNGSAGARRREYGNRSGGSSRDSRPFRERGGGGGQRNYRDNRR
ncbi:YTH domain-containing protein 1 [Drosophila subpulchrella]|uniref:YTH domain-containing protein 1 n=1 Tax=Drosophila subpulchrella TaxID=1486046 RepID=UPI0018A17499|nr:YTH domain-containing protein 1 [Drosophila subpulchrella]